MSLEEISEALINLEEDKVLQIVKEKIDAGEDPIKILEACRKGMAGIGKDDEEIFLTDLIMAGEITVNNTEEFQEMVDRKDFRIAKAIVESILENITTKKRNIHILSVACVEDNAIYDLTLDRKFFVDTLEENLKYFIEQERYEQCQEIVNAINKLKEKSK